MLENLDLGNVMALDIETVPQYRNYQELPEHWKKLWDKKSALKYPTKLPHESYNSAGIYAEFGKVICVSLGLFSRWGKSYQLKIKSYFGEDEKKLLNAVSDALDKFVKSPIQLLLAHNGKEFDFPYLSRRMVINQVKLPIVLDTAGKKPWELNHLDTMELWKFGDFKAYTSLELLAATFDIPTPKDDIDGSMVCDIYYNDGDLQRIKTYCEKDVATLARLMVKFKGEGDIPESVISIV